MNVRSWSVETLMRQHRVVALDANVLIYLLEDVVPQADAVAALIDAVGNGESTAVVSTVALTEVLTGPARDGDGVRFEMTAAGMRTIGLDIVAVSPTIAEDAGWIRGREGLGLGDAIHLATARAAGATAFVTNDRRIQSRPGIEVVYLSEITAS